MPLTFSRSGLRLEPYAAIVVVLPGLFLFGVMVFYFLIRPIQSRDPLNQMLLLVGLVSCPPKRRARIVLARHQSASILAALFED